MVDKKSNLKYIICAVITIVVIIALVELSGVFQNGSMPDNAKVKKVIDMAGREVPLPPEINGIAATSPPVSMTLYMLAPDKMLAWNSDQSGIKYMPEKYRTLPVTGGWFSTQTGNYETFLSMSPDVVFEGFDYQSDPGTTIEERQQNMGSIPVVAVMDARDARNYPASIEFLGKVLGAEEKANELISFYTRMYKVVNTTVAGIPESEKKRVYYAEGPKGLQTDPSGSYHSQLIDMCGGINVANGPINMGSGMTQVSMEEIIQWNPDIIIANNPQFYNGVYSDPLWQNITAVKNKEVYLTPSAPFNWFDRPPGTNTIIGIPWTAKVLYPERFQDLDISALTKEFYSDFYHYDLTDGEVNSILRSSGLRDI